MKILNVLASLAPRYGGPSKSCPELAQALARRGHDVSIYTTNRDGDQDLSVPLGTPVLQQGVNISYFPVQFPRFWTYSAPLGHALKINLPEFDIVHVYSLYFFHGWLTRHYCLKYGIPLVVQPHGTLDPFLYRHHRFRKIVAELLYENANLRRASAILYNTEEERRLAMGAVKGTPSGVVPIGLNLSDYAEKPVRGQFRSQHPELSDKTILLFLSRVNFKKGLDLLVPAFARLAHERPDIRLVIAGPDNEGYGREVRKWCVRLGIADRVLLTGMLSEDNKRKLLADADLFALTSYTENFGITVIEAMAFSLPVLISDRVNTWREVQAAGAGKITRCDVGEIAQALRDLADNPEEARRMGEKGRRFVYDHYQWDKVAEQQEIFYEAVIKRRLPIFTPTLEASCLPR